RGGELLTGSAFVLEQESPQVDQAVPGRQMVTDGHAVVVPHVVRQHQCRAERRPQTLRRLVGELVQLGRDIAERTEVVQYPGVHRRVAEALRVGAWLAP